MLPYWMRLRLHETTWYVNQHGVSYLGILRLLQVYAILLSAYSRQLFGPEEI